MFVDQLSLSELFFDRFQSLAFQFDLTPSGDLLQLCQSGASRSLLGSKLFDDLLALCSFGLRFASPFLGCLALPRDRAWSSATTALTASIRRRRPVGKRDRRAPRSH